MVNGPNFSRIIMFRLTEDLRFYLFTGKVNLRRGCLSLCDIIRTEMKSDPLNERNVYIFMNHSRTIIPLIHYERGFYVMYEKRPGSGASTAKRAKKKSQGRKPAKEKIVRNYHQGLS